MTPDEKIELLRALHAPVAEYGLYCNDCTDYDGDRAWWPCSSARFLYEDSEIAAVSAAEAERRQQRQLESAERRKKREAEIAAGSPLTMNERIAAIYSPLLEQQLKPPLPFLRWQG